MARKIKLITVVTAILMVLCTIGFYCLAEPLLETFAITFGTICYHFAIRLLIGSCYDTFLHNEVDYNRKWFQPKKGEAVLYEKLKVKNWKKNLPTYQSEYFDIRKHTYKEIVMAMCQAELVHETIIVFSFVPILFTYFFGAFWVFLLTSILAAGFDLVFVIIQRYNRPRIIRISDRCNFKK